MIDAEHTVLELFYGRWRSQTLYAGVKLGFFETVGPTVIPMDRIADALGIDLELGYRLARALAALNVLQEHENRLFSTTAAGELLRADHPGPMRDAILLREGPEHTALWKHLPDIVRDGKQTGFIREYGIAAFDYAARVPSYNDPFNAGMTSQSNLQAIWTLEALRGCDLGSVVHLCDVGGGHGQLLCCILAAYPGMRGTVLERAQVLEGARTPWAEKLQVADRCAFVAGDVFSAVPAADAYAMKMILHDWDDAECTQILSVISRCARRPGPVFMIEYVIPESNGPDYAALSDMHMMCWGTGRERSAPEYRRLLESSVWRFEGVRYPESGAIAVVEGRLA